GQGACDPARLPVEQDADAGERLHAGRVVVQHHEPFDEGAFLSMQSFDKVILLSYRFTNREAGPCGSFSTEAAARPAAGWSGTGRSSRPSTATRSRSSATGSAAWSVRPRRPSAPIPSRSTGCSPR